MNSLRSLKDLWNKYKFILNASQKRWGIVVVMMTLAGALFETLGISIILPLVQVIMNPEGLLQNKYFSMIADFFHIETRTQIIWFVGLAVVLVYLAKNAFLLLLSYVRAKYACKVQRELSVEMMRSYLGRGYSFFLNVNTSELLRGMTNSIYYTYEALYQIFKILAEILTVICICVYIMVMDAFMALCVICLAGICLIAVGFGFRSWMKKCGEQEYKLNASVNKTLLQAFQGVKEVLVMNRQEYFTSTYEKKYIKRQLPAIGKIVAAESPAYMIEAVCVAGLILAVCIKALGTGADSSLMISQLASFAVGAFRILPSLGRISSSFNQVVFSMPSLTDTYNNFLEVRKSEPIKRKTKPDFKEGIAFRKKLTIQNIVWKYEKTDKYVLRDLNLMIQKGQSVAFIGQSGAGKTTLADIILGLLYPQKGNVLLDGKYDIHRMPQEWSKIVGFVPQAVYLMDDTIRNNIAFGVAPDEIDDSRIWDALEQAQLKTFVAELADGLDTVIGERGVRFSGGQRQRIAIARALYNNPDILVLDEATSALDNETEAAVMEAIEKLQGQKTLIIIAHRLSTVRKCDVIYEIKDGQAVSVNKDELFIVEGNIR